MKNGVVILNKDGTMTSFSAVRRVARIFGAKKAGHTGTLDPMATGVLPILIGTAVKAAEYMQSEDKHYRAVLLLGITTDTEDITGSVLSRSDAIPPESEVLGAIGSMVGKYMQTPPMYSALKVGGKKLCDIAREGKEIEREAREVTIFSIDSAKLSEREYTLDVHCSKGTYIRTLCKDIGERLGCGAVMSALIRTEASGFTLENARTLDELEKMSEEELSGLIYPTEYIFRELDTVKLSPFFARLARNGLEIYLNKIGITADEGQRFKLCDEGGFFALGEVKKFDTGLAIKPIKQFISD